MQRSHKEPLYRKVNTLARGVYHNSGGDYRHDRNSKKAVKSINSEATRETMHGSKSRGLDYTPLFRFLISNVGQDWEAVHKEAVSRLDKEDPVFWLVAKYEDDRQDIVRIGDKSYYSGLYVDSDNKLQKVNPTATQNDVELWCSCCTYSFNSVVIKRKLLPIIS